MAYNQVVKVRINFGNETLDVEGTQTEVKEAQDIFYKHVLELARLKLESKTVK